MNQNEEKKRRKSHTLDGVREDKQVVASEEVSCVATACVLLSTTLNSLL